MYRLKLGIPVHAVQFTGLNFMEVFAIVPHAIYFSAHPDKRMTVNYWDNEDGSNPYRSRKILDVPVELDQWVVIDDLGPTVLSDSEFRKRYERMDDAAHAVEA